jgi:NAD(P)-dependent dehydrogenase (short-subunit alcohol dehydrogenase family)
VSLFFAPIESGKRRLVNLNQRIAVVTGANRGIGFEICRQLASRGIHVILTSRNEAEGKSACRQLEAQGLDVHYHQLDVTDPESIHRLESYLRREYGRLDILVNNAGVMLDEPASAFQVDLDTVRATMETNVYGPLLLCQALIALMKQHRYGRLVNISSSMGQLANMGSGDLAYRMSKTCLNALTRVMAAELRGTNILVNAVSPGWVGTDMGGPSAPRSVEEGADTAVWLATLPDGGPQGGFFHDRKAIPW